MKNPQRSQRRRRAREIALQVLYALSANPDNTPEAALGMLPCEEEPQDVREYALFLIKGVSDNQEKIDYFLRAYVVKWRPERMVRVDLMAVRLALFEGVLSKSVPLAVAISEAVELAKLFGTEDSGRFVNGVLGKIVRFLEAEKVSEEDYEEDSEEDSEEEEQKIAEEEPSSSSGEVEGSSWNETLPPSL